MRKTWISAKRSLSNLGGRHCGLAEKACPERGVLVTGAQRANTACTGTGAATAVVVNVGISACTLLNSQQLMLSWAPACSLAGQQSLASPMESAVRPLEMQVISESFGATVANSSNSAKDHRVAFRFLMDDIFHITWTQGTLFFATKAPCCLYGLECYGTLAPQVRTMPDLHSGSFMGADWQSTEPVSIERPD